MAREGNAEFRGVFQQPVKAASASDIDAVIQQLIEIKAQIGLYSEIEISFVLDGR